MARSSAWASSRLDARSSPPSGSVPAIKQAKIEGATLSYLEQGQGLPVVFVHGSVAVHRTLDAQRDPTARKYRYIAFDQRYFGPAPWPDDGKHFSVTTHVNDLAVFLRQLDVGPAHLVGWSYGADVVRRRRRESRAVSPSRWCCPSRRSPGAIQSRGGTARDRPGVLP